MDETDMYNYPMVNADGMVCNRIAQTRPKCVVLDPKTAKKQVVGPVATKGKGKFTGSRQIASIASTLKR